MRNAFQPAILAAAIATISLPRCALAQDNPEPTVPTMSPDSVEIEQNQPQSSEPIGGSGPNAQSSPEQTGPADQEQPEPTEPSTPDSAEPPTAQPPG